ncbi:recombinase family protein [Polynucleobacter brandtiae]|uniref:DNA invertase Pin-like site-specific DNA recombinase n=1 Tax=Polynucleobacter brandtiae TaxID=1938816 RepID=A0A2M8VJG7_9BURK|nr:recombinase family protein [Polynucleobacter brandtiae]PJI77142.1 DNA invertase Pin-like site-specific DNA recombinase [Polynucleobacter brandtiae]
MASKINTGSLRCAIYTRKSSEEGLEQGFNSLDAQREACEAFIKSQQHEGWKLIPTFYDDGGYSGGNMDRPGLAQLLLDIDQKKVQVVVVYKVDRLTRSLADFAKIVEQFDAKGVSFVSVTQQFNTTSSMGRLTLNVLLSFAQFEREVTGERIRDKIAASKAKGMWMGGTPHMGYVAKDRTLAIHEEQANLVRHIYDRYLILKNVRTLKYELDAQGITTPLRITSTERTFGGKAFSRGHFYKILTNPVYIGKIAHIDKIYEGQHPAIIDMGTWDATQEQLLSNRQSEYKRKSAPSDSLLLGLVVDEQGHRLVPSHSQKKSKRYRYYVSEPLITNCRQAAPEGIRIPAQELETLVINQLQNWLTDETSILDFLQPESNQVQTLIRSIHEHLELVKQEGKERYELIHRLASGVRVLPDEIQITIKPHVLLKEEPNHMTNKVTTKASELIITTQAKIERCGFGMKLLVGNQSQRQSADAVLVASIQKGQAWLEQLTSGKAKSLAEIAKAERVTTPYITNTIHRAFLAPDIVRAILNGQQPHTLTANSLKQLLPLPHDWDEQRKILGIN